MAIQAFYHRSDAQPNHQQAIDKDRIISGMTISLPFSSDIIALWRRIQYRQPVLRDRYLKTAQGKWRARVMLPVLMAGVAVGGVVAPLSQNMVVGLQTQSAVTLAQFFDRRYSSVDAQLAAVQPAAGAAMAPPKPTAPYLETQSYEVTSGDTLSDVLERADVGTSDRVAIAEELKEAGFNPRTIKPGQNLEIQAIIHPAKGTKTFKGMAFKVSPFTQYQVASAAGGVTAKAVETPMQDVVVSHSLPVSGSVYESMRQAGVPRQLIGNFLKPFGHFVDFQRDIKSTNQNRIEVLYDGQQTVDGTAMVPGDILYAALNLGEKRVALYRFKTEDGDTEFFTQDGKSGKRLLMKTPIDGARLSSGFGMRRHPVLGYSKMHKGVDFAASTGTPIYAAGDGVIEKAGPFSSYGNYIRIRHSGGYKTAYAHMQRYAKGMRAGKRVKQGEVIGYVGTTGRSTGPHLHYEVMQGNRQVNPSGLKMAGGVELEGKDKKRFKAEMARINALFQKSQQRPVSQIQNVKY